MSIKRERNIDYDEFFKVVDEIRGERSIRKFAADIGTCHAVLYNLYNKKIKPEYTLIYRISTGTLNPEKRQNILNRLCLAADIVIRSQYAIEMTDYLVAHMSKDQKKVNQYVMMLEFDRWTKAMPPKAYFKKLGIPDFKIAILMDKYVKKHPDYSRICNSSNTLDDSMIDKDGIFVTKDNWKDVMALLIYRAEKEMTQKKLEPKEYYQMQNLSTNAKIRLAHLGVHRSYLA